MKTTKQEQAARKSVSARIPVPLEISPALARPQRGPRGGLFLTGFTLMEALVYIAVASVVVLAIISFSLWIIQSGVKIKIDRETQDAGRRALEIMVREIQQANGIYGPVTSASQLSLKTKNHLPVGESFAYIDFFLDNQQLVLKYEESNPVFLTPASVRVNNLVFTPVYTNSAESVQIDLTIEYDNPSSRPEYQSSIDLQTIAAVRPQ